MAVANHRFETLLRHTVTTRCYEALLADAVKGDLRQLLVATASRAMASQRCLLPVSLKSDRCCRGQFSNNGKFRSFPSSNTAILALQYLKLGGHLL